MLFMMAGLAACDVTVEVTADTSSESSGDTLAAPPSDASATPTDDAGPAVTDDAGPADPVVEVPCVPSCFDKTCGDDGCEGSCGECVGGPDYMLSTLVKGEWTFYAGKIADLTEDGTAAERVKITEFTIAECDPNCGDAACGDDGCGGSCGAGCADGQQCLSGVCAGFGDVTVSLEWKTDHDLDLHVIDPNGDELSYQNKVSLSGGELDLDAHMGCQTGPGVENVFWATAPDGTYQVMVNNFAECGASTGQFKVTVSAYGTEESYTYDIGVVGTKQSVIEFTLTACVSSCDGKACGDDGCGGSCGACGDGQSCVEGQCAGTGDVQVTLEWGTKHDLDVFVIDPNGDQIYYGEANTAASGGILDIDSHGLCNDTDSYGIENIYWPMGGAPTGTYEVYVNKSDTCDGNEADFVCTSGQCAAP